MSVTFNEAVKQLLTILTTTFFLVSGPASLWADCFRHVHSHSEEDEPLHAGLHSSPAHPSEETDSAARIHCPPSQFDLDAVSSTARIATKTLKNENYIRVGSLFAADEFSSATHRIQPVKPVGYPLLIGISPHLLLSVFRI